MKYQIMTKILFDHLYGHTLHRWRKASPWFHNNQSLHHDFEGELDLEGLRGPLLVHKLLDAADIPASDCLAKFEGNPVFVLLKQLQQLLPFSQWSPLKHSPWAWNHVVCKIQALTWWSLQTSKSSVICSQVGSQSKNLTNAATLAAHQIQPLSLQAW